MPLVGLAWGAQRLSWSEAKSESEAGRFPYPVPLLRAMEDQRNDEVPSASVIAGCLRQFALKRREEYYERPQDLLPSVFGTAFHLLMEKYTEHDPREVEDYVAGGMTTYTKGGPRHKELFLRATVDLQLPGYNAVGVLGRLDYLHEGMVLRDWKSKKFLAQGFVPPPGHFTQGNIYNWLASENGLLPAPVIEIAYVSQSWVQTAREDAKPLADVHRYVRARLRVWAKAELAGRLPDPINAFYETDAKGRPAAPCAYCPVREACMAAVRAGETEEF